MKRCETTSGGSCPRTHPEKRKSMIVQTKHVRQICQFAGIMTYFLNPVQQNMSVFFFSFGTSQHFVPIMWTERVIRMQKHKGSCCDSVLNILVMPTKRMLSNFSLRRPSASSTWASRRLVPRHIPFMRCTKKKGGRRRTTSTWRLGIEAFSKFFLPNR